MVRILASGAGGPGSNPGGVTCSIGEEGLWGHAWRDRIVWWKLNFFDYLQSKMSFPLIEISANIC